MLRRGLLDRTIPHLLHLPTPTNRPIRMTSLAPTILPSRIGLDDVKADFVVCMSLWTVSLYHWIPVHSLHVHRMGDGLKVIWVDAVLCFAQVVQFEPFWDWTILVLPSDLMCPTKSPSPIDPHICHAIPMGNRPLPQPAWRSKNWMGFWSDYELEIKAEKCFTIHVRSSVKGSDHASGRLQRRRGIFISDQIEVEVKNRKAKIP